MLNFYFRKFLENHGIQVDDTGSYIGIDKISFTLTITDIFVQLHIAAVSMLSDSHC